jgi:hypothetical protein
MNGAARKRLAPNRVHYSQDGIPYCPGCGEILSDTRSYRHLGLLFAFIAYIFKNWPEDGVDDFFPVSEEHLRAWLFVSIKAVAPYTTLPLGTKAERQMALKVLNMQYDSLRAQGRYGWPQEVAGGVAVLEPVSIAVYGDQKMSEKDFCEVTRKVFDFIYEKLGVDVQEWKENYQK